MPRVEQDAACRKEPPHRSPSFAFAGQLAIHIDRTFTLDEVPEALAHVGGARPSARSS